MDMGTTLPNQDVAGLYVLTVSTFCAKTLRLGITSVLGGTYALFMSKKLHGKL